MEHKPDFNELLDEINSGLEHMKANCEIGLFAVECFNGARNEAEAEQEINNFFVRKPVVSISSFIEENKIYYNLKFVFQSYDDTDYKQMKRFLSRYTEKAVVEARMLQEGKVLDKITSIRISIIPEAYNGKYFLTLEAPYWETISFSEYPYDKSAAVSFVFDEQDVIGYIADDDMINRVSIEREVELELENEFV